MKIQNEIFFWEGGGGVGLVGGGGVRVDKIEELLKFLGKFTKK